MLDFKKLNILKDIIVPAHAAMLIKNLSLHAHFTVTQEIEDSITEYHQKLKQVTDYMVSTLPKPFLQHIKDNKMYYENCNTFEIKDIPHLALHVSFKKENSDKHWDIFWNREGLPVMPIVEWSNDTPKNGFIMDDWLTFHYYKFDK